MPLPIDGGGQEDLKSAANTILRLGEAVVSLAGSLYNVPLLGKALCVPVYQIGRMTLDVAVYFSYFEAGYGKLIKALQSGDWGTGLEAALDLFFPGWRVLRDDPLRFMLDNLSKSYAFVPDFLQDPLTWLSRTLLALFPKVAGLWEDPDQFVADILERLAGGLAEILRDPLGWLRTKLSALMGVETTFWDDPFGNLWLWLMKWIETHLVEFAKWVYPVAEKVLRYLWEGEL